MDIFIKENEPNKYSKEKNSYMMIRAINFSYISSINNKIIGIYYLNNMINAHLLKNKISTYVNLLSHYYYLKNNDNYINIRKLLANILLKKLINKKYNSLKYYFYKFNTKIFSLNKESSNTDSLSDIIDKYEKIISKLSKEHTQELMKLSNENLSLRTDINTLNATLDKYKQKEINTNAKIKEIKSQYENFQNIIDNMNIKLENLKEENIVYKNKYDIINNKYISLMNDYNNNKKEFEKAIKEMDTYSQLLITLEKKMNKAEIDKQKAENERDKAIMETRNIRERYINIMSNNNIYS